MALRQIPAKDLPWSYSLWISATGELISRHFDVVQQTWMAGKVRRPICDGAGRMGYYIFGRFRTIEQAVALAWIGQPSTKRLPRLLNRDPATLDARNLAWSQRSADASESDEEEEWFPFQAKVGLMYCDFPSVMISTFGRVCDARGATCATCGSLPRRPLVQHPTESRPRAC